MILFKYVFLFIHKFINPNKTMSDELIIQKKNLNNTGIDERNIIDKNNIDDIINFFYKKEILYCLLNNNIDTNYKLNLIDTLYPSKDSIRPFNITAGGLYKDWQ